MGLQILIGRLESDVDDEQARQLAEPLLQSAEQIAPELVVLPKCDDLLVRICGLDVIGVDAALGPERRLPAHGPGKRPGIAPGLVAGGHEQLWNLALVQKAAHGEIAGRPKRAEYQM